MQNDLVNICNDLALYSMIMSSKPAKEARQMVQLKKASNTNQDNASELEHYSTLLHDMVRRGAELDAKQSAMLAATVKMLDAITFDLCEQQEETQANRETDQFSLDEFLNGDAVRDALRGL